MKGVGVWRSVTPPIARRSMALSIIDSAVVTTIKGDSQVNTR